MKTVFGILFLIAVVVYGLGTRIEFKPFRIHFDSWVYFLGWVFIAIGVVIISTSEYSKGLKRGKDITIEVLEEIANKNSHE